MNFLIKTKWKSEGNFDRRSNLGISQSSRASNIKLEDQGARMILIRECFCIYPYKYISQPNSIKGTPKLCKEDA